MTDGYLLLAKANIRGVFTYAIDLVTDAMKLRANKLGLLLHGRLFDHVRRKTLDEKKHNHPVLVFVRKNLNQVASLLYFFDHAIKDPYCATKNNCLLKLPIVGSFIDATDEKIEGCYIHNLSETMEWVRSGKAVGSANSNPVAGVVSRNLEHKKRAAKATIVEGKCFYTIFPSENNKEKLPGRRGYFEDLKQFVGMGFRRDENTDGLTCTSKIVLGKDERTRSLFDWSNYIEKLESTTIRGCTTLKEKQLVVVGYFLELCYDLCISPRSNVSNNPGFEAILGVINTNN